MDYSNRKWVIVNVSDITDEMIVNAIQSSMNTLRKTLDGNKAMTNFPISMNMEGHNAFFITNAVAEGIDLRKKGSHKN